MKDWALVIIIVLICGVGAIFYNTFSYNRQKNELLKDLSTFQADRVSDGAVKEYEIAAQQGDLMQMYCQASLCATAFLQEHDQQNYNKWKEVQRDLGRKLRIPQYYDK